MVFGYWNRLSARQKNMWKTGGYVVGIGSFIKVRAIAYTLDLLIVDTIHYILTQSSFLKFGYFYITREMIIDNLEKRDKSARKYLAESKDFAKFASEDRKKRSPELTPEQRQQLQSYLLLMAQHPDNKEVYPHEMRDMMKRKEGGR